MITYLQSHKTKAVPITGGKTAQTQRWSNKIKQKEDAEVTFVRGAERASGGRRSEHQPCCFYVASPERPLTDLCARRDHSSGFHG